MFDFLKSFQNTPYGVIILGAIGSILAVLIIKICFYIAKKLLPEIYANWYSLLAVHRSTLKTGHRNDTLFLLCLYSFFALLNTILISVCTIRITIYEMVINYQGYKLIVNYTLLFVFFYFFYIAISAISDLVKKFCAMHGLDYEGTNNGIHSDGYSALDRATPKAPKKGSS